MLSRRSTGWSPTFSLNVLIDVIEVTSSSETWTVPFRLLSVSPTTASVTKSLESCDGQFEVSGSYVSGEQTSSLSKCAKQYPILLLQSVTLATGIVVAVWCVCISLKSDILFFKRLEEEYSHVTGFFEHDLTGLGLGVIVLVVNSE